MTSHVCRRLLMAFATCVAALSAADLGLSNDGVTIAAKGMGTFTLAWPKLLPGDQKPIARTVQGRRAELKYAGDAAVSVELQNGGVIAVSFRSLPGNIDRFHTELLIGPEFSDGGTWRVGDAAAKPFPPEKPAKPHLHQGNASNFTFSDVSQHTVSLTFPPFAFLQLQDNREWNWKIFCLQAWTPINRDQAVHTITVGDGATAGAPPAKVQPLVDRFGQSTRKEHPGKVKDEAELRADIASEQAWLAGLNPAAVNEWGGRPGTGAKLGLKKTGFFHVEKKGGRWVLVDPVGDACFHLGICSFGFAPGEDCTYVKDRRDIYEWLPPTDGAMAGAWHPEPWWRNDACSFFAANLVRKHGDAYRKETVLAGMVDRVRAMGFNAVGAFSGDSPAFKEKRFPLVRMLGYHPALPGIRGIGDPFDDAALKKMDEDWAKALKPRADDPYTIGYFFDNEQAFEDVPKVVPQLKGAHAAKRRLVQLLKDTHQDIAAFNAAWNLKATGFDTLADQPLAVTTKAASQDMQRYAELFYEAYYAALATTFRRHDPNHLMLGSRWQPGTANSESLCRAAGRHMDIVSINYYTLAIDAGFMRRLHGWTGGKPQVWSEFYYTSAAESPCAASGMDMRTQRARGQAYRTYVEGAANLGFVVGIEWFTLIDQAVTGRWFEKLGGERNNTGIFNVCDRPYRDLVEEMAAAHRVIYDVWLDGRAPYRIDDPRFAAGANAARRLIAGRATGPIAIDGVAANFPGLPPDRIGGERLVQGRDAEGFEASLKACWDDTNLYIYAQVADPTPMVNDQRGADLWNGDGIEIFIGGEQLDTPGPLLFSDRQVLVGATATGPCHVLNLTPQPACKAITVPAVDGKGHVIEVAIPWSALGIRPKAETELLFDIAVDDAAPGAGRHRQLMWNGIARNSSDRSRWGRLALMP